MNTATAWLYATAHTRLLSLEPTPGPTGFDWKQIRPDGDVVPKAGLFYSILNGVMFLGVAAAFCGLLCGAIAFGIGPIFGAHIVSDRGKSMMWRSALIAIIVGSATAIVAGLISTAQAK